MSLVHPSHTVPSGSDPDRARSAAAHPSEFDAALARAVGADDAAAHAPGATQVEEQPPGVTWLAVLPWADPVIDQLGVDPRSEYVERYWLPLVGPASVLLVRYLAHRFDETPEGFSLDVTHTARVLGLGTGLGRWGPLQRTVHRCANFGFVRRWGDERVLARRHLPTVTRQQLARLPEDRQALHEQWRADLARPRGLTPTPAVGGSGPRPGLAALSERTP